MEIKCPWCGETLESETEVAEGQNVLCPACGKKFRYGSSPKRQPLPVERKSQGQSGKVKVPRLEMAEDALLRWIRSHMMISIGLFLVVLMSLTAPFLDSSNMVLVAVGCVVCCLGSIVLFIVLTLAVIRIVKGLFVVAKGQPILQNTKNVSGHGIFWRVFWAVLAANIVTVIIWKIAEPSNYTSQPYPGVIIEGTRHTNGGIYQPNY